MEDRTGHRKNEKWLLYLVNFGFHSVLVPEGVVVAGNVRIHVLLVGILVEIILGDRERD